jgi:chromate transporter
VPEISHYISAEEPIRRQRVAEVAAVFLKLGVTSFGGPIAHLGYFHEEVVRRRGWLEYAEYADVVALCQFLPGPASSQVVFALGRRRAGLLGALTASLCFTLPSAALMILFAYGLGYLGDLRTAGWVHGLKLAAVAVVAQAVWSMGRRLCPDFFRVALAVAAAAGVLLFPQAGAQVAVIAVGAALGWWRFHAEMVPPSTPTAARLARRHLWAAATLVTWAALLVLLPVFAAGSGLKAAKVFDGFYRSGSLVFGGGHVVLPLLRAAVVPPGWIGDDAFLAGYGAVQAVPGPLFTFAAYLGTVITGGPHAWLGGLGGLFAIFLPAWMLIGGALPFWHLLRGKAWTQAALRGTNAAVVGVLLAALYHPVGQEGVKSWADAGAATVAFLLLERWRTPPWLVVALCAAWGGLR